MKITSTRRFFLQGTAVTGVAAAIAGCSQQSSDDQARDRQQANDEKIKEQQALPSTAWDRAEYDEVADGGNLNHAIGQIPANWNPNHVDGNEISLTQINRPRGVAQFAKVLEDGTLETNPDYVESAEMTSEDPQIITVKFNKDAKWDDGAPIVVGDLIAQQQALNGSNAELQTTSTQGWSHIAEIRQTDDEYSAEIEYKESFPDWISYIYPSAPARVFETPEAFNVTYVGEPSPGCGPFKISTIDATGGVVNLVRNELWWGRAPKLETIVFKVTTQQNAPAAFANGELDMLEIGDGDTYGQAKTRSNASIQKSNGLTWTHLTLNVGGGDGVMEDVEVRKAIFKAINRTSVGAAVVEPLEAPVVLNNNFIYMPGQDGYEDSFDGELDEFGPDAAREVLEAAGYAEENGVFAKDGKSLTFSVTIPAETKSNEDRARQVMTDLNAAGFKVDLQTVPSDKYFTDYVIPGNFDMVTFSWVGTATAELSGPNLFLPESQQNFTGIKDTKLDELNAQVQSETDEAARRDLANEYSRQVASNYMVLPFYATPIVVGVSEGLVNIGASQFESVDWTSVGYRS